MKTTPLIILFFLFSCKNFTNDPVSMPNSLFKFSTDTSLVLNSKTPSRTRVANHIDAWNQILQEEEMVLDYLKTLIHDSSAFIAVGDTFISLGFDDFSQGYITMVPPIRTNQVMAMHLICAVYYESYYFAGARVLFDQNNLKIDTSEKVDNFRYGFPLLTDDYVIDKATLEIINWLDWVEQKGVKKARELKRRPFGNSSIYWVGEPGSHFSYLDPMKEFGPG